MLDVELIQARPALQVDFQVSLAENLLNALSLVMGARSIEGLDQWVYATHAALPPTLMRDMETTLILIQKSAPLSLWLRQLAPDAPPHHEFAALISWLEGFTENDFYQLIQDSLENQACCDEDDAPIAAPSLEDTAGLRAALGQKLSGEQLDRAVHLAHHPLELKAQFISILTRFWEQFYCQEYQRSLPLMERSVAYHRQQDYRGDFDTTFTAVTGRRPLKNRGIYEDVERVVFIPSCHIGPYVIIHAVNDQRPSVALHYNCRPTGAPEQGQTPIIQDLFPPLKALSDETRLQILALLNGRELYAQEIVERLDISQSAVSRHLQLMLSGGLLISRRENSMKYYSINKETLDAVADRLRGFRGKTSA